MLLFRDKEPAFCPAPSPVTINEKKNGMLPLGRRTVEKEPASKNIGDEQLSLLRLLAGIVPHEIRMLRVPFNINDNHCQLIARIFFIHDW
ncbi:hypothetical protein [Escherichia coli]|uniref:hypothetical protein n=1 Tax=Escherichia coli TaxID=562 RepID=UPI0015613018|nr:hypothetical protein [Escherichia coli]